MALPYTGTGTFVDGSTTVPVSAANLNKFNQGLLDLDAEKLNIVDAFSGDAGDLLGLNDAVIDGLTGVTSRVGLCIMVGYNDGGSAWPTLPAALLTDANISIHWIGGTVSTPPPTSAGPALWDFVV